MATTTWLNASNNAVTILEVALASGETRIDVADFSKMPTVFPFRLTIWKPAVYGYWNPGADPDMEIVQVTGATAYGYYSAEYEILRAREGTADVDHAKGDAVVLCITAGMIQQWQDAITALEP